MCLAHFLPIFRNHVCLFNTVIRIIFRFLHLQTWASLIRILNHMYLTSWIRILLSTSTTIKNNLDFNCFVTFLYFKTDVNVTTVSNKPKKLICVSGLRAESRSVIQRMDPRIPIRLKMWRIRKTIFKDSHKDSWICNLPFLACILFSSRYISFK